MMMISKYMRKNRTAIKKPIGAATIANTTAKISPVISIEMI